MYISQNPSHLVRLLCGWEAKHKLSTPKINANGKNSGAVPDAPWAQDLSELGLPTIGHLIESCLRSSFRLIHSSQVPGVCSTSFRLNSDNGTGSGDSLRATIMFLYCQVTGIYLLICLSKQSREHPYLPPTAPSSQATIDQLRRKALDAVFPWYAYIYLFQLKTAQCDSGAEGARKAHQQRPPFTPSVC